jgi:hypothetical protein
MIAALIAVGLILMAIERIWPARELPRVQGWWLRVLLVNLAQGGIVLVAGHTWDVAMQGASLIQLRAHFGDVPRASRCWRVTRSSRISCK